MRMGIVADDLTGSNDIGIMFAKAGMNVCVLDYAEPIPDPVPNVLILNTHSRLDSPEVAYQKVFTATQKLQSAGFRQYFKKTCSVFRGNVGVEFDAMLDALGVEFAVVILGFPKNGRTTIQGIHYVHGVKLEESEFRNDPIHPMRCSNLVEILQAQTRRKVAALYQDVIRQGDEVLRQKIHEMRQSCHYLILDVPDQYALQTIARAVSDEMVLCGSSAIGEELPVVWKILPQPRSSPSLPFLQNVGIPIFVGSLMPQTRQQIEFLKTQGVPVLCLDALQLFDEPGRQREIRRLVREMVSILQAGKDVVLHSPNQPDQIEAFRRQGKTFGLDEKKAAFLISDVLAEISWQVLDQTRQNRLIIAGGETSAAICARLGIRGMYLWKEIQPGLPSCLSLSDPPRFLVLKSGSFGDAQFFKDALDHLKGC